MNLCNKYYWEEIARQMLLEFGESEWADLCNADKPDLQGSIWGIEVTQALTRQDGEIDALSNRVMNKPFAEITLKDKKKMEEYEILYSEYKGKIALFTQPAEWLNYNRILNSFQQKIRKLNSNNYANFPRYGLFLFADDPFEGNEVNEITNNMIAIQKGQSKYFSMVFINCLFNYFWFCDLTTNSISSLNLGDHWHSKFDKEIMPKARQYSLEKTFRGTL